MIKSNSTSTLYKFLFLFVATFLVSCGGSTPIDPDEQKPDPDDEVSESIGDIDAFPTVMSRLNREEYNNTVRDLLGIDTRPGDKFPPELGGLLGNEAEKLSLHYPLLEAYFTTATELAIDAVEAFKGGDRTIFSCDPGASDCSLSVIYSFAEKAWRRPLDRDEESKLWSLFHNANSIINDPSIPFITVVRAILFSPNFIFRPEIDPDLDSDQARLLNAYELASRLSYFLWASMPDDELRSAAADGSLTKDDVLKLQVQRMLDDPKAQTLVDQFAESWFGFESIIEGPRLGPASLPSFDPKLAEDLVQETHHFLKYLIAQNRPFTELVDANYTFLNQSLADHYRVKGHFGDSFELHPWSEGAQRVGLLGQGSFLVATSHPSKTSPVKRGLWVLDKLLCDRPPDELPETSNSFLDLPKDLNPREAAELHRDASSTCFACHGDMDPIGFALEVFDPVGRLRHFYASGERVDTAAMLHSGESFSDIYELSEILSNKSGMAKCAIQRSMSYALGRELKLKWVDSPNESAPDTAAVNTVYENTLASNHRVRDVITEIVLNPAFRHRRGANSEYAGAQK